MNCSYDIRFCLFLFEIWTSNHNLDIQGLFLCLYNAIQVSFTKRCKPQKGRILRSYWWRRLNAILTATQAFQRREFQRRESANVFFFGSNMIHCPSIYFRLYIFFFIRMSSFSIVKYHLDNEPCWMKCWYLRLEIFKQLLWLMVCTKKKWRS